MKASVLGGHCLVVLAAFTTACGPASDENVLGHAEFLCVEERWNEAIPLLKQFLVRHPDHAGAHFYLGRGYLNSDQFRPLLAEGELQTALYLFQRNGRHSSLDRFSDTHFDLLVRLETAEVYLRQIEWLLINGAHDATIRPLMRKCRETADAARQIASDSEDLHDVKKRLADLANRLNQKKMPASPTTHPFAA